MPSRKQEHSVASSNGKRTEHGNTSVLQFDVSETVEVFLVVIGADSKRIPVTQRDLGTDFILESGFAQGRSRSSLVGGRGKGGGRCDKGSGDDRLHGDYYKGFGMVEEEECGREAGPGGAREKKGSRARERGKGNNSNKQIGILVGFDSSC